MIRGSRLRVDCFIDHIRGRFGTSREFSLHQQIDGLPAPASSRPSKRGIARAAAIAVEIIESERDPRVILVRHQKTISFREIDLADLKTRLHETARAQAQQLERGLASNDSRFFPPRAIRSCIRDQRQSQIFGQQFLFFHQNAARVHQKSGIGRKRISDFLFACDPGDRFAFDDVNIDFRRAISAPPALRRPGAAAAMRSCTSQIDAENIFAFVQAGVFRSVRAATCRRSALRLY